MGHFPLEPRQSANLFQFFADFSRRANRRNLSFFATPRKTSLWISRIAHPLRNLYNRRMNLPNPPILVIHGFAAVPKWMLGLIGGVVATLIQEQGDLLKSLEALQSQL
jgi:hypothetical protein